MPIRWPALVTSALRPLQTIEKLAIRAVLPRSTYKTYRSEDRKRIFKAPCCSPEFRRGIHQSKVRAPSKGRRRALEPKDFLVEDQLPSLELLKSARKSKVLDIEPEAALNVLRRFIELSREKPRGWESQVCEGDQELSVNMN